MFSPTGRSWSAVTTDGLLVYSLDDNLIFDPFELDIEITPDTIHETLENKQYLKALVVSIVFYC
jgi:periodic tryptophan protein 2